MIPITQNNMERSVLKALQVISPDQFHSEQMDLELVQVKRSNR